MMNPNLYSKNLEPFVEVSKTIFENNKHLLKWNEDTESVLDIGVGDGKIAMSIFLPNLPTRLKEYVGCDISVVALTHAEELIQLPFFKTLNVNIATASLPQELYGRFDHIFSNMCLHYIRDNRQAFMNIYRMLKPGGQFYVCTFRDNPKDYVLEKLDKLKWVKYENANGTAPFHKYSSPKAEYLKIIRDTGFVDCYVEDQPDYLLRFSEKALEEIYISVNLIIDSVHSEDQAAYIADYLNLFKNEKLVRKVSPENNDGSTYYDVTHRMLVAIATKPLY